MNIDFKHFVYFQLFTMGWSQKLIIGYNWMLPAVVNQSEMQRGQLTRDGTQTNCCSWNGSLMINYIKIWQIHTKMTTISLRWWLVVCCTWRCLAGAVVGGGVLPWACLLCGPGRDHEAGKLTRCAGLCLCPQERRVRERLPEPPTCSSVHSLQR